MDGRAKASITGQTQSQNFPVTPRAFRRLREGSSDAFVAKISEDRGY